MKHILVALALVMVSLTPGVSLASTIFIDNFDGETHGLNYNSFAQWSVVTGSGTVDLIGGPPPVAFFDFLPGNGNYVDLDGSTNNAGIMTSATLPVILGTAYALTFDLAGSQRLVGDVGLNTLTFGIDRNNDGIIDILGPPITLGTFVGFPATPFTLPFTATGAFTDPRIIFGQNGGDNRGLLLDKVAVNSVNIPEPASLMLLGAGLAGIGIWRRKSAKAEKGV